MIILLYIIGVSLTLLISIRLYYKFSTCTFKIDQDLNSKTICITGCTSGLGKTLCLELTRHGAVMYMLCRNVPVAKKIADDTKRIWDNPNIHVIPCDLGSFKSVRRCVSEMAILDVNIDILINNAAIGGSDPTVHAKTEDGLNLMMQTNYFGQRLLNTNARIINVTSRYHAIFSDFDLNDVNYENQAANDKPLRLYAWSKLALVLFTRALAQKMDRIGTTVNCVHPGVIITKIGRPLNGRITLQSAISSLLGIFLKSEMEGIQTMLYLALSPDVRNISGCYFDNCAARPPSLLALDDKLTDRLWEMSLEVVELEDLHHSA